MSYSRPEEFDVYDYATRPQEPSYAALAQPTYASLYSNTTQIPESHAHQSTGQMPYLSDPIAARDLNPVPFIPAGPRLAPAVDLEIIHCSPLKGSSGTRLRIQIKTLHHLTAPLRSVVIMFGQKRCPTMHTKTGQDGAYNNYTIETDIPTLESTGWTDSQVPLMVKLEDDMGHDLGVVPVGSFHYTSPYSEATQYPYGALQSTQRKRKASSIDITESPEAPMKRVASGTYGSPRSYSRAYSSLAVSAPPASPYLQAGVGYALPGGYETRQQQQPQQQSYYQPRYQYPAATTESQPTIKAQSPRYHYSPVSQMTRSPGLSAAPAITRTLSTPGSSSTNPTLIRTSTIQPTATPSTAAPGGVQPFNPYSMYQNSKAVLKIDGDLDTMTADWTAEEWDVGRRLVEFRRSQSGNTITASFEAVTPEERAPNSICISCIWWEEEREHFVTSVDTISLLESLVGVRFTVEEKNRIRRNLEGFQPKTVSKAKAESEEFFKLIMGFPNPKPRNIEKDVKVFKWKILSHALNKIIGKYSASYSSTAALLTPVTSGFTSGGPSEGSEQRPTASPRSVTSSAASTAYRGGMTSTALSPHMPSAGLDLATAGGGSMRVSTMPHLGGGGGASSYGDWPSAAAATGQSYYPALLSGIHSSSSHAARASWDYGTYVHSDPTQAQPQQAPATPAAHASQAAARAYHQNPSGAAGAGELPIENLTPYTPYAGAHGQRTSRAS